MKRQKKIALVNDVTGYGRCSIAVELPLISALKIQGCVLPTAVLSVHTGFPAYYMDDYTERMPAYIESWKQNKLAFDGILTGFLGSARQSDTVLAFIRDFKQAATKVIVDPVMGDYGRLYPSYTEDMCRKMRQLLTVADVITPNLTEACRLLDIPYPDQGQVSPEMLEHMASALTAQGPSQLVLTGLHDGEYLLNYIYEKGNEPEIQRVKKIGSDRSGTGDVFAAIVAGRIVQGKTLSEAVHSAADFVSKAMVYTEELQLAHNCGLAFEEFLTDLR